MTGARAVWLVLLAAGCTADVASPPIVALLTPDRITVPEADSVRIVVRALSAAGDTVPAGALVWAIEDSTVATIDQRGMLRYGRPGSTTAVVISEGVTRQLSVTSYVRFSLMASGTEYRAFFRWCGVTTRGSLYCLGSDGDVTISPDTLTRLQTPSSPIRQLSVGYEHLCAVTEEASGWCWGLNDHGQLGADTGAGFWTRVMTPVRVKGGVSWRSIDAGSRHSCGVTTAGAVYCWGHHANGLLGDGDSTFFGVQTSPGPVLLPAPADTVAAGGGVSCALLVDFSTWCWGANGSGGLGIGNSQPRSYAPVRAATAGLRRISVSDESVCGLDMAFRAVCWGSNNFSQLGGLTDATCNVSSFIRCVRTPGIVPGSSGLVQIAIGGIGQTNGGVTCALNDAGQVLCWGANRLGEVGIGSTGIQSSPTLISGSLPPFSSISVGDFHACGLTASGVAWCWGYRFGTTATRLPFQE